MKKLLFLTSILFLFISPASSQVRPNDTCELDVKSYNVRIKSNISNKGVVNAIIPRDLKKSEYCIVVNNRHQTKEIIISLDELHEVIIYPHYIKK